MTKTKLALRAKRRKARKQLINQHKTTKVYYFGRRLIN